MNAIFPLKEKLFYIRTFVASENKTVIMILAKKLQEYENDAE